MKIDAPEQAFILHWGEMGAKWGINRTMAQIHALLYLTEEPIDAETIQETLQVARSNVSTCMRELLGWGIVRTVHVMGDRRDRFICDMDVWEMFRTIARERRKREFEPTRVAIDDCLAAYGKRQGHGRRRMEEMQAFLGTVSSWADEVDRLPVPMLRRFLSWGARIGNWLSR